LLLISRSSRLTRLPNPKRQGEIAETKLVCLTLLDFYSSVENGLTVETATSFKDFVHLTADKGNLTGLRMLKNDLVAMLEAVPGRHRSGLDLLLRERAGYTLNDLLASQLARIRKIAERGKIRNDTEYYLVREHVEMIWDDPEAASEYAVLLTMLNTYEEAAARRGGNSSGSSPAV
jgi:hypothetical protein